MTNNFDHTEFKQCLSSFATGVTIVTCKSENNSLHGVTINSFSSLSLNPPLILFSLDKNAYTSPIFMGAKSFAVNILSEKQISLSNKFATPSAIDWNEIDYKSGDNASPILKDNISYIECNKETTYDGGDHNIIIGRATKLKKLSDTRPLLYFRSKYCKLDDLNIED